MKNWILWACLGLLICFGVSYFILQNAKPRPLPKIKQSHFNDLQMFADSFARRLQFELRLDSEIIFIPWEQDPLYAEWEKILSSTLPEFKIRLDQISDHKNWVELLRQNRPGKTLFFLFPIDLNISPYCVSEPPDPSINQIFCHVEMIQKTQKRKKKIETEGYFGLVYQLNQSVYVLGLQQILHAP